MEWFTSGGDIINPPKDWDPLCGHCSEHYKHPHRQLLGSQHRYHARADNEEAAWLLGVMTSSAASNREYLQDKLVTHGDLILSRWLKKSREKRALLLGTKATEIFGEWPTTTKQQRNDLDGLLADQETSLWLDIKSFSTDKMKLISLLHLRTAYSPQDWSGFDTKAALRAWATGTPPTIYNENCVVMFGEHYGKLASYQHEMTHTWSIAGFPRAVLTFRAQYHIMGMLRRIVNALVDGAEPSGNTKLSLSALNAVQPSSLDMSWNGYKHQAFSPPIRLDLDTMIDKAQARYNSLLDEAELLQCDPNYMRRVALLRLGSTAYDSDRKDPKGKIWSKVAADLVLDIAAGLDGWKSIHDSGCQAREICHRYGDEIRPGVVIPPEATHALEDFCGRVHFETMVQTDVVLRLLPTVTPSKTVFQSLPTNKKSAAAEEVTEAIQAMEKLLITSKYHGDLALFFDVIQLNSASLVLDQYFMIHLDRLTGMEELRTACTWHQLSIGIFDQLGTLREAKMQQKASSFELLNSLENIRLWSRPIFEPKTFRKVVGPIVGQALRSLCSATWPSGRKDRQWILQSTECQTRLADFWTAVRQALDKLYTVHDPEQNGTNELKRIFEFAYSVPRPEFLDDWEKAKLECEENERTAKMEASMVAVAAIEKSDTPGVDLAPWYSSTPDTPKRRKRTKAKGAELGGGGPKSATGVSVPMDKVLSDLSLNSRTDRPEREPIAVKEESLRVFTRMYSATAKSDKACIRWNDLVRALVDAGLEPSQGAGSAVRFKGSDGAIEFHKPHPSPMVDPYMLRFMGGRLHKWFG